MIAFLGALLAVGLTFIIPATSPALAIAMVLVLPVGGAIAGYEISQASAGNPWPGCACSRPSPSRATAGAPPRA